MTGVQTCALPILLERGQPQTKAQAFPEVPKHRRQLIENLEAEASEAKKKALEAGFNPNMEVEIPSEIAENIGLPEKTTIYDFARRYTEYANNLNVDNIPQIVAQMLRQEGVTKGFAEAGQWLDAEVQAWKANQYMIEPTSGMVPRPAPVETTYRISPEGQRIKMPQTAEMRYERKVEMTPEEVEDMANAILTTGEVPKGRLRPGTEGVIDILRDSDEELANKLEDKYRKQVQIQASSPYAERATQLTQAQFRRLEGARLPRIGIDDEVQLARKVVEDGQLLAEQQQHVRATEHIGLAPSRRKTWLDPSHRVIAQVADEASTEVRQARDGRCLEPSEITTSEVERVLLVLLDDEAIPQHRDAVTRGPQRRPRYQANVGIASKALAADHGLEKEGARPVGQLEIRRKRGVEIGDGLERQRNPVESLAAQALEFVFSHGTAPRGFGTAGRPRARPGRTGSAAPAAPAVPGPAVIQPVIHD